MLLPLSLLLLLLAPPTAATTALSGCTPSLVVVIAPPVTTTPTRLTTMLQLHLQYRKNELLLGLLARPGLYQRQWTAPWLKAATVIKSDDTEALAPITLSTPGEQHVQGPTRRRGLD